MKNINQLLQSELIKRNITLEIPFQKNLSRKGTHDKLNDLSKLIWETLKTQNDLKGQLCVGISFNPINRTPNPLTFHFTNLDELYSLLIQNGVEVYCVVSTSQPLSENLPHPLKENELYFSYGTSFGLISGIYDRKKKTESIFRFSQPSITK